MGRGVPEAGRQCYNSPMNSDLSERAKMPFLGRTLGRGPTKIILVEREYVLARPTSVSAYDMHSWQRRGPPGSSRTIKDRCYITEGASQGHGSDQGYA